MGFGGYLSVPFGCVKTIQKLAQLCTGHKTQKKKLNLEAPTQVATCMNFCYHQKHLKT